jgi:HEPN domain-containing protein
MNAPEAEARRWWNEAQADLAVVRTLRGAGHFAAACFHGQQAAEKALKAVLYCQGRRWVFGHSVTDLLQQCAAIDAAFSAFASDGSTLDQFYIPTRYPNGLPLPAEPSRVYDATQSGTAEACADRILQAVEKFLRARTSVLPP